MNLFDISKITARSFLDVLYPKKCVICNSFINIGAKHYLCSECKRLLYKYGKIIRDGDKYFEEMIAAIPYELNCKQAMESFKFKNITCYDKTFAYCIYNKVKDRSFMKDGIICPVPIHPLRDREYNQSELISRELSQLSGLGHIPDLLIKLRNIPKLSEMNYKMRRLSISGAVGKNQRYNIVGKRIILIDDIYTTGATADECSKILKMYGADEVYVLAAMYAVRKENFYANTNIIT